tara:strand:+ start:1847 stop:3097 length:1251 start_codon:yes stop_codon:yes gene_type:complete
MSALPRSVAYGEPMPSLPADSRCDDVVLRAVNGSQFSANSTIQFDFNNVGFIDPASIYLRYSYTIASGGVSSMIGCPVYAPFARLNVFAGSNQIESQSNFNQTATMLSNLHLNVAQKYGLQSSYMYKAETGAVTLEELDGRTCLQNESGSGGAPLPCILSACEKMIPAFATPQLRLELVVDAVTNMFRPDSTAVPTGITLTNVELCYRQISMGAEVEAMVRAMPSISLRTQSFLNTASVLGAGTAGQVSLVYNQRVASIKSAFLAFASTQTDSNLWGDSCDPTKSNGSVSLTIAGQQYPQTPYNTATNKNGLLQALRVATGNVYDKNNNFSINSIEWNLEDGDATTLTAPAKFFIGVDTEKVDSEFIMSGVSSQSSAISANIQLGTATTDAHNVSLILNYDAVLEIGADGQTALRM